MTTSQLRNMIQKAFGLTTKQLKKIFKKTDFRSSYDIKFLLLLLWNYGTIFYGRIEFDEQIIKEAVFSLPTSEIERFAVLVK